MKREKNDNVSKSVIDVGGESAWPFGDLLKDGIWDKMLLKKLLEDPVLKYDAADKI